DNYQALTLYHRAFLFLDTLAAGWHEELTNGSIQQLRALATNSLDSLGAVVSSCTADITPDDRTNLMLLLASLPTLADPAYWQNPDGTAKTMAQLMGASDGQVYLTIKKLAQTAGASPETNYDQAYADAQLAVKRAGDKLDKAKQQLAAWLN